jgi:CRISPR-associated protein (TIGR02710 family)
VKALIVSVGTGVRPSRKAVESLANAISFSANHHNPDKIFFIVSPESQKTTLPKILHKTKSKDYEVVNVRSIDNIQQVYEDLQPTFTQIRKKYDQITVDYTSGTKAMTGALTILGTIYEADALSYIAGKREAGIVQAGTEEIRIIKPYFATAEQKMKTAIQFFNQNQFNASITILNQIEKATKDRQITNRTRPLRDLAEAYDLWDKFRHQEAFKALRKIEEKKLDLNKRFLGQMLNTSKPEPYYIADMINNAKRRGTDEKKYDDAVARLYRTIELIAQHQLKTKHNLQASDIEPTDIPEKLKEKWGLKQDAQKIRIPLEKAYELLESKNDPLGKRFTQDTKLRDLLNKRNTSILAHNLKPVDQKTYVELHQKTIEYAKTAIKNLNQLLADSTFIKLAK